MNLSWLWIVLAVADYGVFHSLLASNLVKRAVAQQSPVFYTRYYRLMYNAVAVISLLPLGILLVYLPDRALYAIPFPYLIVTGIIQLACAAGMLLTLRSTGMAEFLGFNQALGLPEEQKPLKTDGLYRLVRHPLYTLGFIILVLNPLMTVNRLAMILSLSIYMVIGALLEERRMVSEYGETYTRYRQATPMFFPDFSRLSEMK